MLGAYIDEPLPALYASECQQFQFLVLANVLGATLPVDDPLLVELGCAGYSHDAPTALHLLPESQAASQKICCRFHVARVQS